MRLFYLIEKNYTVRSAANLFRELTALIIADISGRRTDKTRHRVFLHILRHVKPDHCVFIAEQGACKCLAKLGFADTRGTEEYERSGWAPGVFKSHTSSAYRLGDRADSLVLTDYSAVKLLLHVEKPLAFSLRQLHNRNASPR